MSTPTPQDHRARALELRKQRRFDEAIAELQTALRIKPDYAPAYFNIALCRMDQGCTDEAAAMWRKAIEIKPDYWQAYSALGAALRHLGKLDEAIAACREAIRLKDDEADPRINLATALHAARKYDEASAEFERILQLAPQNIAALNNYGNLLEETDRPARAAELYRRALSIDPNRGAIINNLGNVLKIQARIDEAIECYRKTLSLMPDAAGIHSNLLLTLNCHPHADEGLLREHVEWAQTHAAKLYPQTQILLERGKRLRIGYVSADFRRHAVSYFFEPILLSHDRSRFEIFCYSNVERPDDVTAKMQSHADHWRPIAGISDERAAQMIRDDRIDILVDLSGHTAHNRLQLFARKPAPVQVTYLGYPNTTGLGTMDYRLTDEESDPTGVTDSHYTEKLIRLPRGFLCYKPPENAPPARQEFSAAAPVTFGTFNNFAKVTQQMIALWSRILLAVPDSRLLIKAETLGDEESRRVVHGWFASHGVNASRVELLPREPFFVKHLAMYHRMEIGLDTFPYHGTTTTCEAMWMGVPVITLAGRAHVSRVGLSLLTRVGLGELIAATPEEYVGKAIELAKDHERRRTIATDLRERMRTSPLMDTKRFTLELEAAYGRISCDERK
jgi:protein O-GlcNAc transferase